ncbi:MAG: phosphate ABC transporter permease PstA [Bacillota bacterium]
MTNQSHKTKQKGKLLKYVIRGGVYFAGGLTLLILASVIGFIMVKGIMNLEASLFEPVYTSKNGSFVPALVNTLIIIGITLVIAVPLGVFSAIYLCEYAKKGSKLVKVVRMTTETLAGIPSIVFGLFGYICFVNFLGWGYSLLGGAITLALMVLPAIMRSTEEALLSVPVSFREGSFGLGAGKLRTIFKIILPSASAGIFAAIVLAVGRIVGETAALIFTAGSAANTPDSLFGSGRTLAVHVYMLWNEGLGVDKAYACAVILIVFVLSLNLLTSYIESKFKKSLK